MKQKETIAAGLAAHPARSRPRHGDLVIDINQSTARLVCAVGMTPCLMPRSMMWHVRLQRVLTATSFSVCKLVKARSITLFEHWQKKATQESFQHFRHLGAQVYPSVVFGIENRVLLVQRKNPMGTPRFWPPTAVQDQTAKLCNRNPQLLGTPLQQLCGN